MNSKGIDYVTRQVQAIDQRLSRPLFDLRKMKIEGGVGPCKGCGYPHSVVSYEYEQEEVVERVCHDCAWPKMGNYLKEKEVERQFERAWNNLKPGTALKEKREYATQHLEEHARSHHADQY